MSHRSDGPNPVTRGFVAGCLFTLIAIALFGLMVSVILWWTTN